MYDYQCKFGEEKPTGSEPTDGSQNYLEHCKDIKNELRISINQIMDIQNSM